MSLDVGAAIYIALKPILKIYTIIFVGYLLAKYDIVSMNTAKGISNMVVNAILPCLTFNKIVTNISWRDIKEIGVIVLSAILLFAVGAACSYITNKTTPVPKKWFWGIMFCGIFPNISDLPIAYVQSMGGGLIFTEDEADKGVAYTCIFLFTQSFMMMNFGMWRLVGLDFREKIEKDGSQEKEIDDKNSAQFSPLPESSSSSENGSIVKKSDLKNNDISRESTGGITKENRPSMETDESLREDIEMSSIDSEVFDEQSDINTDNQGNNTDDNRRSKPFDYIKPFEKVDSNSDSSNKGRSNSFSRHNQSFLSRIISSPSVLQNDDNTSMFNRRNYSRYTNDNSSNDVIHDKKYRKSTMRDVIVEYSAVEKIKTGKFDLSRPMSIIDDIGNTNTKIGERIMSRNDDVYDISEVDDEEMQRTSIQEIQSTHSDNSVNTLQRTATLQSNTYNSFKKKMQQFIKKYKLGWLVYIAINFIRPASLGALLGIIVALIPWVKACFVDTYVHVHKAPDKEPVLNFLMDFTGYIGNACVPLGLLLLGGTLARLEINSLPKGFIKSAIMMTIFRLVVLPIIGIAWTNKLTKINWLETRASKFIMILTWAMPSATAQVYFTAFYTPTEGDDHIQMDCLSVFFIIQYSILFITLSIVVTYALKLELHV